jgi:hypothetical protein
MASGAPDFEMVGSSWSVRASRVFFLDPGCSSWLLGVLGAEEDDARVGYWSRCYEALALLSH